MSININTLNDFKKMVHDVKHWIIALDSEDFNHFSDKDEVMIIDSATDDLSDQRITKLTETLSDKLRQKGNSYYTAMLFCIQVPESHPIVSEDLDSMLYFVDDVNPSCVNTEIKWGLAYNENDFETRITMAVETVTFKVGDHVYITRGNMAGVSGVITSLGENNVPVLVDLKNDDCTSAMVNVPITDIRLKNSKT